MQTLRVTGFVLFIGAAAWTGPAGAQLFSSTGPVIAILDGELLVGEATGHLGGWGTLAVRAVEKGGRTCTGEFSHSEAPGDAGQLRCSDGASAAFRFERLSLRRGYGSSSSGRALSFTYGLSAEESVQYLKLPAGKTLGSEGGSLALVAAVPVPPR